MLSFALCLSQQISCFCSNSIESHFREKPLQHSLEPVNCATVLRPKTWIEELQSVKAIDLKLSHFLGQVPALIFLLLKGKCVVFTMTKKKYRH